MQKINLFEGKITGEQLAEIAYTEYIRSLIQTNIIISTEGKSEYPTWENLPKNYKQSWINGTLAAWKTIYSMVIISSEKD